jgi:hypothetical protein
MHESHVKHVEYVRKRCVCCEANSCPISKIKSMRHKHVSQGRKEEEIIVCNISFLLRINTS